VLARFGPLGLVLAAGCGRIAFESVDGGSTPDDTPTDAPARDAFVCVAPIGHDEDGDLVDDACDGCPHLADPTQPNVDGDGLTDACDGDPEVNSIALFDPYRALAPHWSYFGPRAYPGDVLRIDGLGTSAAQSLAGTPPARARYEIGGDTFAVDPATAQLSMGLGRPGGPEAAYCELYYENSVFFLGLTYTPDSVAYFVVDSVPLTLPMSDQPFRLSLERTGPTELTCRATWRGADFVVGGSIPSSIPFDVFYVAQNRLDVELRYFIQLD